ncbi:MAG: hypothetical protein QHH30_08230 [candidate division NC10 bacterium]|nr:hypothetical protein [candidate division NC10 bacterium]
MRRIGFVDLKEKEGAEIFPVYVFKKTGRKWEFERSLELPPQTAASSSSPSLAGIGDFHLSLPLQWLNFRILNLPFSEPEKLREVIPFELDGIIMDRLEGVVFDAMVLGSSNGNYDILVAYANQESLKGVLRRLASLNIDPRRITCLDLRLLIQSGVDDFALRLLQPGELDFGSEDRIQAARQEIASPTINLRIGPLAPTEEAEKTERGLRILGVLSISLALLINAHLVAKATIAKKESSAIRSEMRAQYAALFPQEKNISDELYLLKSHMKEFQDKREALTDIDLLQLLMDLSEKNIQGVTFHEITVEKTLITIKGETPSANEIEKVKTNLETSLQEISISEMKPSGAGRFLFAMMAKGRKR